MIGYSRPLNEHFQVSADATVVNLTQPILPTDASFGLGSLPAGNEYYYSAQLIGSNLAKDGDMYIFGLRYSQLMNSNMYVVDFNVRYPVFPSFAASPRLRLGYRTGKGMDLTEYTVLPSVLFDYYWTKELSLEFEIGAQRIWTQQAGIKDSNAELFLTLGLRYDFYADDTTRRSDKASCSTPVAAALCRYSVGVDKGNCASPPTACR
jgi:outer membrane receptor protein involved in Fe transport